jgi:hypothetical protein
MKKHLPAALLAAILATPSPAPAAEWRVGSDGTFGCLTESDYMDVIRAVKTGQKEARSMILLKMLTETCRRFDAGATAYGGTVRGPLRQVVVGEADPRPHWVISEHLEAAR